MLIAYLVGAGLTKALETTRRVPLMADFVSVMADHLDDRTIAAAMAEFELSGWFEWPSTPVGLDLAKRVRAGDTSALTEFSRELKRRPSENIEDLLVKANQAPSNLFVRSVNRLFWRIGLDLKLGSLKRFLSSQNAIANCEHVVTSFNYDLALDRCVQELNLWHPSLGYGFRCDRLLKRDVESAFVNERTGGKNIYIEPWRFDPESQTNWRLIKPHGSLSWVYIYRRWGEFGIGAIVDDSGLVSYAKDIKMPSRILAGGMSGSPISVTILGPGYNRKPNFDLYNGVTRPPGEIPRSQVMTNVQRDAIANADEVYILGWSMPPTDGPDVDLLRAACQSRRSKIPKLVIVNRGATLDYFQRVRSVFGDPEIIETHNDGFEQFVIDRGA
jgi:hypothetical protein